MYILGIHEGHNSSCCLLKDGRIEFAIQEERLVRVKNYWGFPERAVEHLLGRYRLAPSDIDRVAIASEYSGPPMDEKAFFKMFHESGKILSRVKHWVVRRKAYENYAIRKNLAERMDKLEKIGFQKEKTVVVEHHLAHASAAYYGLAQDLERKYLVLTIDGSGDGLCSTVNIGQGGKLKRIAETKEGHSMGDIYARVTAMMGFTPLEHEYKLMGMAPYASPKHANQASHVFNNYLGLDPVNSLTFKRRIPEPTEQILRRLKKDLDYVRFDAICGGLQDFTEKLIVEWVGECVKATGIRDILCSGGVFMNVKANKRIMELPEVDSIAVFPSCGDETNSLGAAWYVYNESKLAGQNGKNHNALKHFYLGGEVNDDEAEEEIKSYVKNHPQLSYARGKEINRQIAELLAEGKAVARCSGKMEFGARALGNRSILADPLNLSVLRTINMMVKKRDFWMPFAPIVMEDKADLYIKNTKKLESPYMMMTFDSTDKVNEFLAAVHNADLTARAQILKRGQNPDLEEILSSFEKLTGRAVLLNTSFNLHGYPIVYTAKDALEVFVRSGLDYLVINDFLVWKEKEEYTGGGE